MIANAEMVGEDELVARYILFRNRVRADGSVKSDAFIPPPNFELSVTRHLGLSVEQVWGFGKAVASQNNRPLIGRADIKSAYCLEQRLCIMLAPLPENSNHANIVGWPENKESQKQIAQELAAKAVYVPNTDF